MLFYSCILFLLSCHAWNPSGITTRPVSTLLHHHDRRQALSFFSAAFATSAVSAPAAAQADAVAVNGYTRSINAQPVYTLQLPPGTTESSKPVKTHLDEINFAVKPDSSSKWTLGITVDPVRIATLTEFGSPEQVAAKVVLAEVNRDGVTDVTLLQDPAVIRDGVTTYYQLEYLSVGKRGKHTVCKIGIVDQRLYVVQAQAKEDVWSDVSASVFSTLHSFGILASK